ncbi:MULTISPECIES: helix-turn-helix transcriptional regulator [Burkholderia]|uniref:helix-turn-helix transcriptional regulator n=1 Tax=Burkholderia TaxID=32008 RepID=UPI0007543805|nr:AlpA family transcriptional regulator [Burkholderia ubonensis]KWN02825.1 AlpA family transcriptional regulator [Burkholderia ubonensis]KWN05466.1 AlpA family transcriptional regulator [Burkholderia ubonensis]ODQ30715.1 AlpA family transcriptional regulator [Burkholderia ubonensis]
MANKVLRIIDVMEAVGVKKSTIYQWVKDGKFPVPLRLGTRSVGWRQSDVESWLEACEQARAASNAEAA